MTTFVFYADEPSKRRADGRNTVIAQGADASAARAVAEALIGEPGAFAVFRAVDVSAAAPAFVVEGRSPVGSRNQIIWPTVTRGGDLLRGN